MSQVQDYALRGHAFAEFNFLDFTVETYEIRKSNVSDSDDEGDGSILRRGRARNVRADYLHHRPKIDSHIRIQRAEHHNYLPNIIGTWFPRRDKENEEDFYYASVLALLRPWRDLQDLRSENKTWKEDGENFLKAAKDRHVIAGMQYYYDSKSKAQGRNQDINEDEASVDNDIELDVLNENDVEQVRNCLNIGLFRQN